MKQEFVIRCYHILFWLLLLCGYSGLASLARLSLTTTALGGACIGLGSAFYVAYRMKKSQDED
jgi:predicted membrane channel-forming protein YqfA (hemolysin III family)